MHPSRIARACDIAQVGVCCAYLAFAHLSYPRPLVGITVCPWHLATGLDCPFCGSTRFIGALLHGVIDPEHLTATAVAWFATVVALVVWGVRGSDKPLKILFSGTQLSRR